MARSATGKMADAFTVFIRGVQEQSHSAGSYTEGQLTAPCRGLLETLIGLVGLPPLTIVDVATVKIDHSPSGAVGIPDLSLYDKTGKLVLCVELKAPGKGSNPEDFTIPHDREQWERYKRLPNVIYTDGNSWTLWHSGKRSGSTLVVCEDITAQGATSRADPDAAERLFQEALSWVPTPITSSNMLAHECAKYCRMLRDEARGLPDGLLDSVSRDWRNLLFPELDEGTFVDAYAQTVTFALLTAGSLGIELNLDLDAAKYDRLNLQMHHIASELEKRRSVLGKALSVLTNSAELREKLHVYLEALLTIVGSVEWEEIRGAGNGTATDWLNFYEDFLAAYDPKLRKLSGSYYTPSGIVEWMTTFTDTLLATCLDVGDGYADENVTVVDPAVGTGTFLLSVLDRIARRVERDTGEGLYPAP